MPIRQNFNFVIFPRCPCLCDIYVMFFSQDYSVSPPQDFWDNFPSFPLPGVNDKNTPINVDALNEEYLAMYDKITGDQRFNMQRTIDNMRNGADALIDPSQLTPMSDENSKSVLQPDVGRFYTDQLATMVKNGFVAGPFDTSPLPNLRLNSLFAVNQSDKYRPILNLSKPEGNAFNEAIIPAKMRKVTMSTSRQFADTLYNTGPNSVMSKIDHVSAYKLVPVKHEQFYLQGFRWLDKIFIEVRLIFGARSSVPNYDDFHQTVSDLVRARTNTDPQFLHRTLDDQCIVTQTMAVNKLFIQAYLDLAKAIDLPLADMSGHDKAFLYRTSGTVLGIFFDTPTMTWKYSEHKRLSHMKIIESALCAPLVTLQLMQKVAGVINTLTIMCPLLRFLRAPVIAQLSDAYASSPVVLRADTAKFLHLWLHIFRDLQHSFPISKRMKFPPVIVMTFVTDAAGRPDPEAPLRYDIGVGAAGTLAPYGEILYVGQALWPPEFVLRMDVDKKLFGRKTTLLEAIGLLVPLYHNASQLHGRHIVLQVDNLATVWAFDKGRAKTDMYTSVIMTALNHVASSFCCKLYVQHCPRLSCQPAVLADLLSRTNPQGLAIVAKHGNKLVTGWPPSLLAWLLSPSYDWSLGVSLVQDFKALATGKKFFPFWPG